MKAGFVKRMQGSRCADFKFHEEKQEDEHMEEDKEIIKNDM